MTNIIAPEDIEAGRYPGQDSQIHALEELGAILAPFLDGNDPALEGAMAYGGAIFMQPGGPIRRTSDVDVYGLMTDESLALRKRIEAVLGDLAVKHGVHVDLHLATRAAIHMGRDGISGDVLTADYLTRVRQGNPYIYGDPFFGIYALDDDKHYPRAKRLPLAYLALEAYIAHKIQRFTGAVPLVRRESNSLHRKDLQRAFEVNGALARKLITAFDLKEHGEVSCVIGGRSDVEEARRNLPLSEGWHELFTQLQEIRDVYLDVLEDTIAGRVSVDAYRDWLLSVQLGAIENAHDLAVVSGDEILGLLV